MDRRLWFVGRSSPRDILEHLRLKGHHPAHGGDQVGQLVVALLEHHVDVGPGPLTTSLQRDHVVVRDHHQEHQQDQRQRDTDPDRELQTHRYRVPVSMPPRAKAQSTVITAPRRPTMKAES